MSSLARIYDIGEERADRLADLGFESVRDVASADVETLTTLDGVGRSRAEKIRYSARQLLDDTDDPDDHSPGTPGGERQEYVTTRDVAAGDVLVLVSGGALVTGVGETEHREVIDAGIVSLPGETFLRGEKLAPAGGDASLALDATVVCFPANRVAVDAPALYEAIVTLDAGGESPLFPDEAFLGCTATAVDGETLLGLDPGVEPDVVTLLRHGTVFAEGRLFDFENPHEVSLLQSGGVYVSGDAVLPEGAVLSEGAVVREATAIPEPSLFDTGVVPVDGTALFERARREQATPQTRSLLGRCGCLLPPGSTLQVPNTFTEM